MRLTGKGGYQEWKETCFKEWRLCRNRDPRKDYEQGKSTGNLS